ncbi:Z1 domain-containing protein [Fictibacillus macauensis]|nr:Z1 domain-containing protein [Fictibacillus macauensis]
MKRCENVKQSVILRTDGELYSALNQKNNYSSETKQCIEQTVEKLMSETTDCNRPGMLLGKIQSGKTRTFIGIAGLAFDNGYEVAIVLTKGTRALAKQTYERLSDEFADQQELDALQVFDIMTLPSNLTNYELNQKLMIVVKKEKNNMNRLHEALFKRYPQLQQKRTLLIDDEADFASFGFTKTKSEILEINVIAGQIDTIRKQLTQASFLQVTATPYSLYLQPATLQKGNVRFQPIKPAFTSLVPVPDSYIGSEYYFKKSRERRSIAAYLYEPIAEEELVVLKKQDRRRFKLEEALHSRRIRSLRSAFLHFIVGGVIRRLQCRDEGKRQEKYSFIIHTEMAKKAHEWQEEIALEIKQQLTEAAETDALYLTKLVEEAYCNIVASLSLTERPVPSFERVKFEAIYALAQDHVMITKVNSERDVNELLDRSGQLKLRVPLNIFIGGQILDRGITVSNLIGFYYGRNPRTFQQDTVLQHSRMFGYRPLEDVAVTRFYTTEAIYAVMEKIHEFDTALRRALHKGHGKNGVVFIQRDQSEQLIPCSPNKIVLSNITTLKPYKRMLPVGFQTRYKTYMTQPMRMLDQAIKKVEQGDTPVLIDYRMARQIVDHIAETFDGEAGNPWDVTAFLSCLEYLAQHVPKRDKGKVWLIIRRGRNMGRMRQQTGRFEDAPDTPSSKNSELRIAREIGDQHPVLILTEQQGSEDKGWRGSRFWWPILVAQRATPPIVFTSATMNDE